MKSCDEMMGVTMVMAEGLLDNDVRRDATDTKVLLLLTVTMDTSSLCASCCCHDCEFGEHVADVTAWCWAT